MPLVKHSCVSARGAQAGARVIAEREKKETKKLWAGRSHHREASGLYTITTVVNAAQTSPGVKEQHLHCVKRAKQQNKMLNPACGKK